MVQLIMDGFSLPETQKRGYTVEKEPLTVSAVMLTGRQVIELRGKVWKIKYSYGYFNDEDMTRLIDICEKGRTVPISCGFLEQGSVETLTYSNFYVTNFTRPQFMWSREMKPVWGGFTVELREVEPSD